MQAHWGGGMSPVSCSQGNHVCRLALWLVEPTLLSYNKIVHEQLAGFSVPHGFMGLMKRYTYLC